MKTPRMLLTPAGFSQEVTRLSSRRTSRENLEDLGFNVICKNYSNFLSEVALIWGTDTLDLPPGVMSFVEGSEYFKTKVITVTVSDVGPKQKFFPLQGMLPIPNNFFVVSESAILKGKL